MLVLIVLCHSAIRFGLMENRRETSTRNAGGANSGFRKPFDRLARIRSADAVRVFWILRLLASYRRNPLDSIPFGFQDDARPALDAIGENGRQVENQVLWKIGPEQRCRACS